MFLKASVTDEIESRLHASVKVSVRVRVSVTVQGQGHGHSHSYCWANMLLWPVQEPLAAAAFLLSHPSSQSAALPPDTITIRVE